MSVLRFHRNFMPAEQHAIYDRPAPAFSRYGERGYCWPLRAFAADEANRLRERFLQYWNDNIVRFEGRLPRERVSLAIDTHLALPWVSQLALHPAVLDAVEQVLGPDVMIWNTHWFPKFPGDGTYVSWHQDAAYWGLNPPHVTTAWIALSVSVEQNGCMRVVPGSHLQQLPQIETFAPSNMLSRGQEIAVELDESRAVSLELQPGEFSLHHIGIAHGSGTNRLGPARIGLAVRYIAPEVRQAAGEKDIVILARGRDQFGHFDIVDPPEQDWPFEESPLQNESLQRKIRNNATFGKKD